MTLYTETAGHGPPLLFIHGWGMHGGFWASSAEQLQSSFSTTLLDLPGHGHSPLSCETCELPVLAEEISEFVREGTTLVGWSLGGMIALEIARRFPQRIARLILVDSTPRFQAAPDWPHAMATETLEQFSQQLEGHTEQTLQRFLALQAHGCSDRRQATRHMRALLAARPMAHPLALQGGLNLLRTANLLPCLAQISCPTLLLHGNRDAIIPHQAALAMDQHMPDSRIILIQDAGHAPFLTHEDEFVKAVQDFCHEP